jgi:predicted acetyltransferase
MMQMKEFEGSKIVLDVKLSSSASSFYNVGFQGEKVGYGYLVKDKLLIDTIGNLGYYIEPAFRRRGFASKLFVYLLEIAKEEGFGTLLIRIKKDNTDSLAFMKCVIERFGLDYNKSEIGDEWMIEVGLTLSC